MAYNQQFDLNIKSPAETFTQLLQLDGSGSFYDGNGNQVFLSGSFIESVGSASWASSSVSSSYALSASWAPSGGSGTSLTTGSTYPITASHALSSSFLTLWDITLNTWVTITSDNGILTVTIP
jgi:hypothetical protein